MRCPRLGDLPFPPANKQGWPWTIESRQLPNLMSNGKAWPRISVVTPSYNQGKFIEETIRSVLLQGYPDLEYIVMDGGSTDKTCEIVEKYAPWLTHYEIKKDNGQAHAVNKGFSIATGTIGAYLNSDDFYLHDIFGYIAEVYTRRRPRFIFGRNGVPVMNTRKYLKRLLLPIPRPLLLGHPSYDIAQESSFWSIREVGLFDEQFYFCLDVDFFLSNISNARIVLTSKPIGYFRHHPDNKTTNYQHIAEAENRRILNEKVTWRLTCDQIIAIRRRYFISSFFNHLLLRYPAEFLYVHPKGS